MIGRVSVGGGVRTAARGGGAALVFDLVPGFSKGLGEMVVHGAGDRDGVGGCGRFRLFVVLAQAAAEVLLDHRVAHCVSVDPPEVVGEV